MRKPYEVTEGKGKEGENCNVTHCQKAKSAYYYHKDIHAWYCLACATDIQQFATEDHNVTLFPALLEDDFDYWKEFEKQLERDESTEEVK